MSILCTLDAVEHRDEDPVETCFGELPPVDEVLEIGQLSRKILTQQKNAIYLAMSSVVELEYVRSSTNSIFRFVEFISFILRSSV